MGSDREFVDWSEVFVSQEKGSRVVHYYFKDSLGEPVLAVVGTERSIRHMVYVVSDEFLKVYGSEKSRNAMFKWRSRREVVNWLNSFVSKKRSTQDSPKLPIHDTCQKSPADFSAPESDYMGSYMHDHMGFARKLKGANSDILWSGSSWTCSKQLKHYSSFSRNGTTISIHSFVLVMSEEENHYLAYLEDMYEDRKGQRKVRVRWFHQSQEVIGRVRIPPPAPHAKEVFITPYAQVISAECVDGLATILIPMHYEKCLAARFCSSDDEIHLCFRQFCNNRVKPFNLSKFQGYYNQEILSRLDLTASILKNGTAEDEDYIPRESVKKGPKRFRSCRRGERTAPNHFYGVFNHRGQVACEEFNYPNSRYEWANKVLLRTKYVSDQLQPFPPFKVDEKIELLCQDSGIRGCWFRCTVLEVSRRRIKVQYDDVQDEDGCGKLEEWIPAFRAAVSDKLGMRCGSRLTVRPCPPEEKLIDGFVLEIGTPVDAWWNDGWWEGVVTGLEKYGDDAWQVYFPGEEVFSVMQRKYLRISRDWFENQWVEIEAKPDILSVISEVSPGSKLSTCSLTTKGVESGGSAISEREPPASEHDLVEENKRTLTTSLMKVENELKSRKRSWTEDEDGQDGVDVGGEADVLADCNNDDGGYGKLVMENEGPVTAGQTCEVAVAS